MFERHPYLKPASLAGLYGLMLLALMIGSPLRTVGDGGEYLVYALGMSHGDAPPLTRDRIKQIRAEIGAFDPDRAVWEMEKAGTFGPDGRLDFPHFWLYPALAAPLIVVTERGQGNGCQCGDEPSVPFLAVGGHGHARRLIACIAVLSAATSIYNYRPVLEEFTHRPTAVALWVWRHFPAFSHPRPDVFAQSLNPRSATVPIATQGCDKILLIGRGDAQGMWPRPCPPWPVPVECRTPGALCYANRSARAYEFRRVRWTIVSIPGEYRLLLLATFPL